MTTHDFHVKIRFLGLFVLLCFVLASASPDPSPVHIYVCACVCVCVCMSHPQCLRVLRTGRGMAVPASKPVVTGRPA